eukprot:SAG11_NODE_1823_length_4206_cov_11.545654_4_plen_66_part_00
MHAHAYACTVHASVGTWIEVCSDGVYSHPLNIINEVWEEGGDLLFCDPDFDEIKKLVRDAYRVEL